MAKKGLWSPTPGDSGQGNSITADKEPQGRKRKASGSPKGATKSPRPKKPSKTPPKPSLVHNKDFKRKQGRQTPQDRPPDSLTPTRKRIREEGIVRKRRKKQKGRRKEEN